MPSRTRLIEAYNLINREYYGLVNAGLGPTSRCLDLEDVLTPLGRYIERYADHLDAKV